MKKIILHCDLDAFFCRAEEIKNPHLEGKSFIVGGDGRGGIVSTCSYKAREYGIHSGMPTFQAKMLCKDLIIVPTDFHYYSLLSKEFIFFLKQYSSKIQQMSIDECFVDLTDYFIKSKRQINDILSEIQTNLYNKLSLKCSIGVGTTKFIAKMASDFKKPLGITIIRNKDISKMIFPLPVKDFFGIGKKTAPRLNEIGINTIGDLYYKAKNNDSDLEKVIGKFIYDICDLLEANSDDVVLQEEHNPKSIGMSKTLMSDTNNSEKIIEVLKSEIISVHNSLIKEEKLAKTITIQFKDAACESHFKSKTYSKTFDEYTQNLDFITKEAIKLFNVSYNKEYIRLIGFSLKNLIDKSQVNTQMTFLNFEEHEKENKSYLIMNELNREMNKQIFKKLSDIIKK